MMFAGKTPACREPSTTVPYVVGYKCRERIGYARDIFFIGWDETILQRYGWSFFAAWTGLAGLSPVLFPGFLYVAGAGALLGGLAGLVGYCAPERRNHVPTLVFVSTAGQCRDPMAKAIIEGLFVGAEPAVRIVATALRDNPGEKASRPARYVVQQQTGRDLLEHHRSRVLDEVLVRDADLILTMDEARAREIRKNFHWASTRIFSLLDFVGEEGDIEDPWRAPDQMDPATLDRYLACYRALEAALTKGAERIYTWVTGRQFASAPRPLA